ncbi:hypothetical protein LCGC14_1103880 [marine sediment metagenome]|uniref:Uncharacterized protein n=1 Tax=marine sediment metagenome TaxID=412755 RepID=A0A0F9M8S5_9ZZZZ
MSAIGRLKELLKAASGDHDDSSCYCYNEGWGKNRCRVGPAEKRLAALAIPLAEELVTSQEALADIRKGAALGAAQFVNAWTIETFLAIIRDEAAFALRLEKLEAVMER